MLWHVLVGPAVLPSSLDPELCMSVDPFECLLRINRGFAEVLEGLRALRKQRGFEPEQVRRFEQLAQETRAATNSHLLGVLESQETNEAGRLFRRRLERERRDERAPQSG